MTSFLVLRYHCRGEAKRGAVKYRIIGCGGRAAKVRIMIDLQESRRENIRYTAMKSRHPIPRYAQAYITQSHLAMI